MMEREVVWQGTLKSPLLRWGVTASMGVVLMIILIANNFAEADERIVGWDWLAVTLPLLIAVIASSGLSKLRVEVRRDAFEIFYGDISWPRQKISWDVVANVRVIDVRPTQWGGWGYRWVPWRKAWAAVLRAGEGLKFEFGNGKVFVITIDDADAALAAIRRVLDELPPARS
jgi:hypothetical protein